jgi:hypothetical protein
MSSSGFSDPVFLNFSMDPYRASHFEPSQWIPFGFDVPSLITSIPAMLNSINHPNVALEARNLGYQDYLIAFATWVIRFTLQDVTALEMQV